MYTPFHVYTNYIFPFLAILGLVCLIEGSHEHHFLLFIWYFPGILIQFKREGAKKTRFWTPYRLADAEWLVTPDSLWLSQILYQSIFLNFSHFSFSAWLKLSHQYCPLERWWMSSRPAFKPQNKEDICSHTSSYITYICTYPHMLSIFNIIWATFLIRTILVVIQIWYLLPENSSSAIRPADNMEEVNPTKETLLLGSLNIILPTVDLYSDVRDEGEKTSWEKPDRERDLRWSNSVRLNYDIYHDHDSWNGHYSIWLNRIWFLHIMKGLMTVALSNNQRMRCWSSANMEVSATISSLSLLPHQH